MIITQCHTIHHASIDKNNELDQKRKETSIMKDALSDIEKKKKGKREEEME